MTQPRRDFLSRLRVADRGRFGQLTCTIGAAVINRSSRNLAKETGIEGLDPLSVADITHRGADAAFALLARAGPRERRAGLRPLEMQVGRALPRDPRMWHPQFVILPLVLRRLLPLLAVLGLALAPVTASASAVGMRAPTAIEAHAVAMPDGGMNDMAGMAMDDMPCCPHETPAMPACSKGCPLMALCLAKVATGLPGGLGPPARVAVAQGVAWAVTASFDSLAPGPLPEPPRS